MEPWLGAGLLPGGRAEEMDAQTSGWFLGAGGWSGAGRGTVAHLGVDEKSFRSGHR
ncbi:MAG: hypothetical protein R3F11_05900 [Verrucomicrobiales bacterium]